MQKIIAWLKKLFEPQLASQDDVTKVKIEMERMHQSLLELREAIRRRNGL